MSAPLYTQWQAGLHILRYLKSTQDFGILYKADQDSSKATWYQSMSPALFGWMDLDWAGDMDSCHSTTGYWFTLGTKSISWSSKKQPTVALSSTQAKYRAACSGTYKFKI